MKLTSDDLHKIVHLSTVRNLRKNEIAEKIGAHPSTIGRFLNKEIHKDWWSECDKPRACGRDRCVHLNPENDDSGKKLVIITCAQNNTYVHEGFLDSLETLKKRFDGVIKVGTSTYNRSGFHSVDSEGEWYDPRIADYIDNRPLILADGLQWRGELNILPTAAKPFSRFKSYTGIDSAIIPHVKAQLVSCATRKVDDPKILYTTGAITLRNYIQKTAGQIASFNHVYSAIVVEIDKDGTWFATRVNAESETGNFMLHDTYYTKDGFDTGVRAEAFNPPDVHCEEMPNSSGRILFNVTRSDYDSLPEKSNNKKSALDYFKPTYMFLNDLHNGTPRNHHNIKDPLFRIQMKSRNTESVEHSIKQTARFLKLVERKGCQNVVVASNHDLVPQTWAMNEDWKNCDATNTTYLLKLQLKLAEAADRLDSDYYLFEDIMMDEEPAIKATFLRIDDSFEICGGIECAYHSHLGVNGARGSYESYRQCGTKFNIGHIHQAVEIDGMYSAGATEPEMSYNRGLGTRNVSFIITHTNGKRAIYTVRNNKFMVEYRFINGTWRKS